MLEVLMAAGLLVVVLFPLMTSGSAVHRRSAHTELRSVAAIRARTLIDVVAAVDFEILHRLHGSGDETILDLDQLFDLGTVPFLTTPGEKTSLTARVRGMLALFRDRVSYRALGPDLARIDVSVRWMEPGSRPGADPREIRLSRLIHRPEASQSGSRR